MDVMARAACDIRGGGCRVVALAAEPGRGESCLVAKAVRAASVRRHDRRHRGGPAIGSNSS